MTDDEEVDDATSVPTDSQLYASLVRILLAAFLAVPGTVLVTSWSLSRIWEWYDGNAIMVLDYHQFICFAFVLEVARLKAPSSSGRSDAIRSFPWIPTMALWLGIFLTTLCAYLTHKVI